MVWSVERDHKIWTRFWKIVGEFGYNWIFWWIVYAGIRSGKWMDLGVSSSSVVKTAWLRLSNSAGKEVQSYLIFSDQESIIFLQKLLRLVYDRSDPSANREVAALPCMEDSDPGQTLNISVVKVPLTRTFCPNQEPPNVWPCSKRFPSKNSFSLLVRYWSLMDRNTQAI